MANLSNINNKFLVTTGGNVGINTTSPGQKLVVTGNIGTSGSVLFDDNQGINFGNSNAKIYGSSSDGIKFNAGGSEGMRFNQSGNLGIGTTSPYAFDTTATKLHVKNDSAGSGNVGEVARFEGSSDADGSGGTIRLGTSNDRGIYFEGGRTGSVPYGIIGTTEYNGAKTYSIYLQNTGNVGIGTTSPTYKLHIDSDDANDDVVFIHHDNPSQSSGTLLKIRTDAGDSNGYTLLDVQTNNGSALFVRGDRNVGIGTTTPNEKLVIGTTGGTQNIEISNSYIQSFNRSGSPGYQGLNFYASSYAFNVGNVGIGTTSPTNIIHTSTTSNAVGRFESTDATAYIRINDTADSFYLVTGTQKGSIGGNADVNANNLNIDLTNGNVGIGTTSPGSKLEVKTSGTNTTVELDNSDTNYTLIQYNAQGATKGFSGFNAGFMLFGGESGTTTRLQSGGSYAATILENGNFGIGTTSPSYKLEVNGGTALVGGGFYASSDQSIVTSSTYTFRDGVYINNPNSTSAAVSSNSVMSIGASSGNSVNTSLITTGAVGIGTTSPAQKLHVDGSIYSVSSGTDGGEIILANSGGGSNWYWAARTTGLNLGELGAADGRIFIANGGNVGIGTTSPTVKLDVRTDNGVLIKGASGSTNGKLSFLPASGGRQYDFRNAGSSFVIHDASAGTDRMYFHYNGNLGIGTTSPYSLLDVDGAITNGSATNDSNISTSTTAFSQQDGGALHITWGLGGNAASGSTIVFTYAATSWKSWTLKYNFASTNGITQGVIGGYWNNSGGNQNSEDIDNLGCSAAVTHGGTGNQNIIVTFTFTALGTHPMANFVYMQAGGDGHPRADRVSIQGNNAV